MTMALVQAGHAVVAKIGGDSVGPAIGNRHTFVIEALCRKSLVSGLILVSTVATTVASAIASVVVFGRNVGLAGEGIDKIFEFRKDFSRIC